MKGKAVAVVLALVIVPVTQTVASPPGEDRSSGEAMLEPPEGTYARVEPSDPGVLAEGDVPDSLWWDTSDYMLGSVSVQVFFPESTGSGSCGDPDQESWTSTQKSTVLSEIDRGLNWWEDQAPQTGDNRLSFHRLDPITVPTCWEPIRHPGPTGDAESNQWAWIRDAMEHVGYDPGDDTCPEVDWFDCATYSATRSFAHDLRNQQGTDWAFSIFVVDSEVDDDGTFADGFFAYAYRNGPFQVMTWDNDGWGIDRMDRVAAHETGHIFGATDEYDNGDAHERSGYFWIEEVHLSGRIMDDSSFDEPPSEGTQGQIGWRDAEPSNDRMDPLDTAPVLSQLETPQTPRADPEVPYAGQAEDVPYPAHENFRALGYHNISINDVTDVHVRLDGDLQATASASPSPYTATFSETITVPEGEHTVQVVAENQVGGLDADPPSHTLVVDTTPPETELIHPAPGNTYVGPAIIPVSTSDDPAVVGAGYAEADASDALTGISHVSFFVDGSFVGADDAPPYETTWVSRGIPGSQKTVTALAVDAVGNTAQDSQTFVVGAR